MASVDTTHTFQCSVVTPERAILECEARFVAFPAHDGEIGVLRGRAPLLCQVGIGFMRAETAEETHVFFIDGGFAQMVDNRLTILTEQALAPSEIDAAAARQELEAAQQLGSEDGRTFEDRQKALRRAREQIRGPRK